MKIQKWHTSEDSESMDGDDFEPPLGGSYARGFSDAVGKPGPLTRTDYREELDLSGRSLSYTAGLASTCV